MLGFKEYLSELHKPKGLDSVRKTVDLKVKSIDARNQSWMTSITNLMGQHGFNRVGSGKYATVYINPSYRYAIKVFMRDAAYQRWLDFALKNRNNPYVPKIRGKVVKLTKLVYAIRLEKLTPYKRSSDSSQFMKDYNAWKSDNSYTSSDPNIQAILDHFKVNKKLLDLHSENMMMRGKQLVIIDPYYNWFGKSEPGQYMIDPHEINDTIF